MGNALGGLKAARGLLPGKLGVPVAILPDGDPVSVHVLLHVQEGLAELLGVAGVGSNEADLDRGTNCVARRHVLKRRRRKRERESVGLLKISTDSGLISFSSPVMTVPNLVPSGTTSSFGSATRLSCFPVKSGGVGP